jgi:hypothetical protein
VTILLASCAAGWLVWQWVDRRIGNLALNGKPGHTTRMLEWRDMAALAALWTVMSVGLWLFPPTPIALVIPEWTMPWTPPGVWG